MRLCYVLTKNSYSEDSIMKKLLTVLLATALSISAHDKKSTEQEKQMQLRGLSSFGIHLSGDLMAVAAIISKNRAVDEEFKQQLKWKGVPPIYISDETARNYLEAKREVRVYNERMLKLTEEFSTGKISEQEYLYKSNVMKFTQAEVNTKLVRSTEAVRSVFLDRLKNYNLPISDDFKAKDLSRARAIKLSFLPMIYGAADLIYLLIETELFSTIDDEASTSLIEDAMETVLTNRGVEIEKELIFH